MKYILTWESCCEVYFEQFDNIPAIEKRAKNVFEEDRDAESITVSRHVKKYTRKIVEEKLDD